MKALVYNGPGKPEVEERPYPDIVDGTDAVIKLLRTTICGTDLHILKGDVPTVPKGRILGHEGIGIVDKPGPDVKKFKKGDKVLIACITHCCSCNFCKRGMQAHCSSGGWTLGHTTDGTQAEYVRIRHADGSLHMVPEGAWERELLLFSDILPTGLEIGVLNGGVKPGDTVAIVGAGPVGLGACISAQLYSPSEIVMIDKDEFRLEVAKTLGATHTINPGDGGDIHAKTKDHHGEIDGFDVVIEAVGVPATFEMCQQLVGKGGSIANIGVHGSKVDLHMESLWIRSIKITSALVSANTIQTLLALYKSGKLNISGLITHDFIFKDILQAYDIFGRASETKALKVNISFE